MRGWAAKSVIMFSNKKNSEESHAYQAWYSSVKQCTECMEKLPNFMQLLKHIAKHHTDDECETKVIQLEEKALEKKVHKEDEQLEELGAELCALKKLM